MTAAPRHLLRVIEGAPPPREQTRPRASRLLLATFVVLAIATVAFAIFSSLTSERRAVRALPEQQRRAILARTVDELRQTCAPGRPEGLKDHCRELATFAAQFDECKDECETLVRRELVQMPTR